MVNMNPTTRRLICAAAALSLGAAMLSGCGAHRPVASPGATAGSPQAADELVALFRRSGAHAFAQLRLMNVASGETSSLAFISTAPPEIQANQLVYFLRAYRGPVGGDDVIATLAVAFPRMPTEGSYYSSAGNRRFAIGLCNGGDFTGSDGRTSWSDVGGSHASLRLNTEDGVLVGPVRARLEANDGASYYLVEEGLLALR